MNFSNLSIKRPVATIMIMLMVVVIGVLSIFSIPQDLLPDIEYPIAVVMASYTNASPEEVETLVTKPLEQALASVSDLDTLTSMSMPGQSIILLEFQMDTDMNFATLNMREKVALIEDYLPDGASSPMVLKMDVNAMSSVQIFVSADMPLDTLTTTVNDNILSYFERTSGVASVGVTGGLEDEISMVVNQETLTGYGLSLATLSQILAAENINMPSGEISKGDSKVIVRTMGEFDSVDDIKNIPITLSDRSVLRLQDIASIEAGTKSQTSISRVNGETSIGLAISKQSDANTVEVSDALHKTIDGLEAQFPELTFTVGYDQADYIRSSINSVSRTAIEGAVLAILVVFLFLKNMRSTLIVALSIPTSLLATFAIMNFNGMTLNVITLSALTLSIGMLVDDAVIVLENVFRVRQGIEDPEEASREGTKEISLAVVAATLTKVMVFLPIATSSGMAGLMFKDFCTTIIVALLASLVVALTIVPMLCSKLLSKGHSTDYIRLGRRRYKFRYLSRFTAAIDLLTEWYGNFMKRTLKKRKKVVITCISIFLVSISLIAVVGAELIPASDEGTFTITIDMPYGTSLESQAKYTADIEEYILSIPEVSFCTANIGSSTEMLLSSANSSSLSVTLVDMNDRRRSTSDIVADVKQKMNELAGADITVEESSSMGTLMGGAAMTLVIKGKELDELKSVGNDLAAQIAKIEGISSAELDITEGDPEVKVSLDRTAATYYGVNAYQLANGLSSALSGQTATRLKVEGNEIDINLSLPDTYNESIENMQQIMITGSTGIQVPVGQIATLEYDNSPNIINRENQSRYISVNVYLDGTRDLGSISGKVLNIADKYNFPDGYYYETGGQQEQMVDAFSSLGKALFASFALVFLLLAAQFESIIRPFIVMTAVPFAMSGAFFALFLTGTKLSMTSFLGLIMLVGIVVNNSILLVEFIRQNKDSMPLEEALIKAGQLRLRPILMTTAATCAGMIPLSLGLGEGTEMLAPMGITIIGGLIASTIVTLIFVPVLYGIMEDYSAKRKEKKRLKDEAVRLLEEEWAEEDRESEQIPINLKEPVGSNE
ncbi:MAG: efflux RND transporter permease subunit [Eubacteriales bacterium]|nr:efflux RND transporter permease subunit [Eubacteriales bacterium]